MNTVAQNQSLYPYVNGCPVPSIMLPSMNGMSHSSVVLPNVTTMNHFNATPIAATTQFGFVPPSNTMTNSTDFSKATHTSYQPAYSNGTSVATGYGLIPTPNAPYTVNNGNNDRSFNHRPRSCYNNNRNQVFNRYIVCQICDKPGHSASKCHYRNSLPQNLASSTYMECQICKKQGHSVTSHQYRKPQANSTQGNGYIAMVARYENTAPKQKEKVAPLPANKKKVQHDKSSFAFGGSLENFWGCASVKPKSNCIAENNILIPTHTGASAKAQICAREVVPGVAQPLVSHSEKVNSDATEIGYRDSVEYTSKSNDDTNVCVENESMNCSNLKLSSTKHNVTVGDDCDPYYVDPFNSKIPLSEVSGQTSFVGAIEGLPLGNLGHFPSKDVFVVEKDNASVQYTVHISCASTSVDLEVQENLVQQKESFEKEWEELDDKRAEIEIPPD
ncbi:putative transcription factor interactor and regulator CCHC(Zn) family [Rosa chinensis]|uniref:Putative transcription factor interactor and regulator CCHC(Zn) family n=1 Tax=Rosa chinensis TaxID=74649 RepID=A0A2P6RMN2_ROSCH|nr:putative transcription factor interactor and regulator CCHC(Zn) family [Rosa chinensis]